MKDFKEIKKWLADADAVIVTAGNGFAQMEGLDMFDNLAFPIEYKNISEKYHVKTIADALDKDLDSWDEKWQFWVICLSLERGKRNCTEKWALMRQKKGLMC